MEALMMENEMSNWNDDRLDELNRRVENGFAKVDKRFERVATREEVGEVRTELGRLNDRFDRLLYVLIAVAWGFAGTVLAAVVGLFVALL